QLQAIDAQIGVDPGLGCYGPRARGCMGKKFAYSRHGGGRCNSELAGASAARDDREGHGAYIPRKALLGGQDATQSSRQTWRNRRRGNRYAGRRFLPRTSCIPASNYRGLFFLRANRINWLYEVSRWGA